MPKFHIQICLDQEAEGVSNNTSGKDELNAGPAVDCNGRFEIGEASEILEVHFESTNVSSGGFTVWLQGQNPVTESWEDVDYEDFVSNRGFTMRIEDPMYYSYRTIIKSGDYTDGTLNAFAYFA